MSYQEGALFRKAYIVNLRAMRENGGRKPPKG